MFPALCLDNCNPSNYFRSRRHTTNDVFKAFVAADLWRSVNVRLLCVVAAADHGFRVHVGAIDDVLLWRGERRLLNVFIKRGKSGPSDVHQSVTQPRLMTLYVGMRSTASSSFAHRKCLA